MAAFVLRFAKKENNTPMNWDRIEGNWKQVKGKAREQWGKLTDSDWDQIAGQKDQLVGRIQERYGISKDEAQKQADAWAKAQTDTAAHEQQAHRGAEKEREPQTHGSRR
jgi:uncharacterized protein YjbJ (UPF0337 family)